MEESLVKGYALDYVEGAALILNKDATIRHLFPVAQLCSIEEVIEG